jgi:hypothetical protein
MGHKSERWNSMGRMVGRTDVLFSENGNYQRCEYHGANGKEYLTDKPTFGPEHNTDKHLAANF